MTFIRHSLLPMLHGDININPYTLSGHEGHAFPEGVLRGQLMIKSGANFNERPRCKRTGYPNKAFF